MVIKNVQKYFFGIIILFYLGLPCFGEEIFLKNGKTVSGNVKTEMKNPDYLYIENEDGVLMGIPKKDLASETLQKYNQTNEIRIIHQ